MQHRAISFACVGAVDGLPPGVYRYQPQGHRLVKGLEGDRRREAAQVAYGQRWLANAPAFLVINAVAQRTARKYRRRADHYVSVEAGAAAQNVLLQAVSLELSATTVGAFDPQGLQKILGTKKVEEPLLILPIGWAASNSQHIGPGVNSCSSVQ